MKLRLLIQLFALVISMVFAMQVNAQVNFSVGQTVNLSVEQHVGSTYYWQVYTDVNTSIVADASSFQFTSPANSANTSVVFSESGTYYPTVIEMSPNGCSTGRYVPIVILEQEFYTSFPTQTSTLCFAELVDGISLPVSFTGSGGEALEESAFPITLSFSIDGVAQTPKQIQLADQSLVIDDSNISGIGSLDRTYQITLTGATDAQNQTIQAQTGQDTFELTLLAQPLFSFAQSIVNLTEGDSRSFTLSASGSFTYNWKLEAPDGSETTLASNAEISGEIPFNQPGVYLLQAMAHASNSCSSAWKQITINVAPKEVDPEPEAMPTLAIDDINQGWKNETLYGNVLTNDLHGAGTIRLTVLSQPDPTTGRLTAFNRQTGAYTFVPAANFTGDLQFEYELCETAEDGTQSCTKAYADIQILETNFANAKPSAVDKYFAVSTNGTLSGNFLTGDFDLSDGTIQLSSVNSSSLSGTFNYQSNGSFTYTPAVGFAGVESFSYKVCSSSCDWASVTIYVLGDEFALTDLFAGDAAYYNPGVLSASLPANKRVDGSSDYSYALADGGSPQHGTVQVNADGTFTYTPLAGETGYFSDQFVYRINTSAGESYATAYISSFIEEPVAIIKNQFETGSCISTVLDASKSTGVEPLTYSWSPSAYLSDATSSAPVFYPGETSTYTLTVTDALGNTKTRTVNVVVAPAPDVVADTYVFVENPAESVLLDASASIGNNLTYSWTSAGSGVIVSGQNTATPEVKGVGKYNVTIIDAYGCMDQAEVVVGVWIQAVDDQAEVLVNNYVSINVLRNDIPQGDLNPESVSIVIPPANGVAEVRSDSTIVYTPDQEFVGQDNFVYQVCTYQNRCDEANVLVVVSEEALFIPNAFTPNGDGFNDYFEIKGLRKYDNVDLKIYNRWGNLIYQANHYGQNGWWDGVANVGVRLGNGPVAAGTYFYSLNLGKGQQRLSGFVYIER